VQQKLGLLEQ